MGNSSRSGNAANAAMSTEEFRMPNNSNDRSHNTCDLPSKKYVFLKVMVDGCAYFIESTCKNVSGF